MNMSHFSLIHANKVIRGFARACLTATRTCRITAPNNVRPAPHILFWLAFTMPFKIRGWGWFGDPPADVLALKYWVHHDKNAIIEEADKLFEKQDYLGVYELLNRFQCWNDPNVLWRIARALYKLTFTTIPDEVRQRMVAEAFDIMTHALEVCDDNANVHKWMAIILNLKHSANGLKARIQILETVKFHLCRAIEIDPNDTTLLYMCGKMTFDLANMSWFQRRIADLVYIEPPNATYDEAYSYFVRAEHITPGFYIGNLVMLGKTAERLGLYHRAVYYLNLAMQLPVYTDDEKDLQLQAIKLANTLQAYELKPELV